MTPESPLYWLIVLLVVLSAVAIGYFRQRIDLTHKRKIINLEREQRHKRANEQVEWLNWLEINNVVPPLNHRDTTRIFNRQEEIIESLKHRMTLLVKEEKGEPTDIPLSGNWRLTDDGEIEEITDGNK